MMPHSVWERLRDPYDFLLFMAMKRLSTNSGVCFASTRTLAQLARMSPAKVSDCKQRLQRLGLIRFQGRMKRSPGGRKLDHYALRWTRGTRLRVQPRRQCSRGEPRRSHRETEGDE